MLLKPYKDYNGKLRKGAKCEVVWRDSNTGQISQYLISLGNETERYNSDELYQVLNNQDIWHRPEVNELMVYNGAIIKRPLACQPYCFERVFEDKPLIEAVKYSYKSDYNSVMTVKDGESRWQIRIREILRYVAKDKVRAIRTCCGHTCFIVNDISCVYLLIPDNVKSFFRGDFIKNNPLNYKTLRVIGGANLEDTSYMFFGCSNLVNLDVSTMCTSNVKYMNKMFSYCTSLVRLDLSSFATDKVLDMGHMFKGAKSLCELNLSSFVTEQVLSMEGMFYECYSLLALDVPNFHIYNAVSINSMFLSCDSMRFLDISGMRITRKIDINRVFQWTANIEDLRACELLRRLYVAEKAISDLNPMLGNISNTTDFLKQFKGYDSSLTYSVLHINI